MYTRSRKEFKARWDYWTHCNIVVYSCYTGFMHSGRKAVQRLDNFPTHRNGQEGFFRKKITKAKLMSR